jgi:tetratricopeptide (TPR) repeat protein
MDAILKKYSYITITALLFLISGFSRINDLSLYNDCTRYLIWGNSIAEGKGFVDDTQPVPKYYVVNAPLYSAILSPVLLFFPLSLTAAKIWTLLLGAIALFLFYKWLGTKLDRTFSLLAVIIFAFNPLTLILSTEVLSETSFICAILLVFIMMESHAVSGNYRSYNYILAAVLSLVILLREIGVAVAAAAILFFLLKKQYRNAALTTSLSVLAFIAWTYRNLVMAGIAETSQSPNLALIFHHFVTSPDATLLKELSQRITINYNYYSAGLSGMMLYYVPSDLIVQPSGLFVFASSFMLSIRDYIFLIFLPALLAGILTDFRKYESSMFRLLFAIFYLAVIFIYPVQDIRFIFPLLPLAIYYMLLAPALFYSARPQSAGRAAVTGIAAILILPNLITDFEIGRTNLIYSSDPAGFTHRMDIANRNNAYFSTPWKGLGKLMENKIAAGTVVATPRKEIAAFCPDLKFLEINRAVPLIQFETMLRNYNVEYILAPSAADSILEYQSVMDESNRFRFRQTITIGRLNLFRVESKFENPHTGSGPETAEGYSLGLMRYGRNCILNEKYDEAIKTFGILTARFPQSPDFKYQLFLIHTFMHDSAASVALLQKLYSSPLAASYTAPAQMFFNAMIITLRGLEAKTLQVRSQSLYSAARLYWNLGYRKQAFRIIRDAVDSDTNYFTGLLWAWHFANQLGDLKSAQRYLQQLDKIDCENPVVQAFGKIDSVQISLRQTVDPVRKSDLHAFIAREYYAIELTEEAADEAQIAVGQNPHNRKAWVLLEEIFEKNGYHGTADRMRRNYSTLK